MIYTIMIFNFYLNGYWNDLFYLYKLSQNSDRPTQYNFYFNNLILYFYLILFLIVIVRFTALRYQLITIN